MNVFYTKTSGWEEDYFKQDLFNQRHYDIEVNFLFFDDKFTDFEKYKNGKNIIITNIGISVNYMETMIKNLNPKILFHLSDEYLNSDKYYKIYRDLNIPLFFHQYNSADINYPNNHFQIPLGYVKYFNNTETLEKLNNSEKFYDFSFVGSLKSDRKKMLYLFGQKIKRKFISLGVTNWGNPMLQNIEPTKMKDIYEKSILIPIGRGNKSLDCFRIYEAIVSGSIPVIVGSDQEIERTFHFNGIKPNFLYSDSWENALLKCEEILKDKEKQQKIIDLNFEWWVKINMFIISKIKNVLK